jgi:histidinol-phosphate/aromatic aminotransferase/cobyric acid decarboxylase-like protein
VGVTFALPEFDFPADLKRRIVADLLDASWNRYPSARVAGAVESFATALQLPTEAVSLFRGADEAIVSLVRASAPRTVVCPAFGFPGYGRAARASQAAVVEYEPAGDLSDLVLTSDLGGDALIIVCWPGNPVGNVVQIERLIELRPRFATALVDLTYLNPFGAEFAALVPRLVDAGIHVAFSFSKCLSLAGVRLGGLLIPHDASVRPTLDVTFPWDLFQVIVLDSLMDPANRDVFVRHHEEQRRLGLQLCARLEVLGARVLNSDSANFVSVSDDPAELDGVELDEKRYPALGLRRVDCSRRNLELLNGLASRTRG